MRDILNIINETVVTESAPPGKKAKSFIKKAKKDFKERYGKEWKSRLYATAWKLFGENAGYATSLAIVEALND